MERWQGQAGIPKTFVTGRSGWCWTHRGQYASEWQAISSIAPKVGVHPETLRLWPPADPDRHGRAARAHHRGAGAAKEMERENRELRRANEILKSAAAFFGAELDGRHPR